MENDNLKDKRTSWGFAYKVKSKPQSQDQPKQPKSQDATPQTVLDIIKTGIDNQIRLSEGNGQNNEANRPSQVNFRQFDSFFERHLGDKKAPAVRTVIVQDNVETKQPTKIEEVIEDKPNRKSQMIIEEALPIVVEPSKELNTIKDKLLKQFVDKDLTRCVDDLKGLSSDVFKLPIYKVLVENDEMKNFSSSKKSKIQILHKLINFLRRDEKINLKGQEFYPYDCFCVPVEYVEQFIKETMMEVSKAVEPEMKNIIVKPNLKNILAKERNEVLRHMLNNFEGIFADLEDIEKNKGADWEGLKQQLVNDFERVQKQNKHLTYQKELAEKLNHRNLAFVEKNLESFSSSLKILENNYNELDKIVGKVDNLERTNSIQKSMLFSQLYDPFANIYESSSLSICKDLLGLE